MRFLRLSKYYAYYSGLNTTPRIFHVFMLFPNMIFRGLLESLRNFQRFIAANKLEHSNPIRLENLPDVELLVCAVEKDFHLLERCITQAIKHSANRISTVSIIVPSKQIDTCFQYLTKVSPSIRSIVQILDEELLISENGRHELKRSLGDSYGWGLQQFLTVAFVLQSHSAGVLAVNADTLILRKRHWLQADGFQEILVSSEYHRPYYSVLKKINPDLSRINYTFICHQMLFQPQLLKRFLEIIEIHNVEEFIDKTLAVADLSKRSPFCVEFEFYGQSMHKYCREKIALLRFGNIPYKFSEVEVESLKEIVVLERNSNYNSVSQHSWISS